MLTKRATQLFWSRQKVLINTHVPHTKEKKVCFLPMIVDFMTQMVFLLNLRALNALSSKNISSKLGV